MILPRFFRAFPRPNQLLGGLHSAGELQKILERERARADRSGMGFTLLKFSLDNERTSRAAAVCLAEVLKRRLRFTDEAGWLSDQAIGAVLPCTTVAGARSVASDIRRAFGDLEPPLCEIYWYPSSVPTDSTPEPARSNGRVNGSPGDHPSPPTARNGASGNHNGAGSDHSGALGRNSAGRNGNGDHNGTPQGINQAEVPARPMEPLFAQTMSAWKRGLDIFGSTIALIVLLPLFALVAVAITVTSPGPVFFKQRRAGLGGEPFEIYKFRSMRCGADALKCELMALNEVDGPAFKIKDDPRVTRLGQFLRRTSIDELPQFWNVLKGDMSLVGPRPLPWDEAAACTSWQRERLNVTPGLTCTWQVRGRSLVSFDEWMRMDLAYVENKSFVTDMKILAATVPAVLFGRGAY